MNVILGCTEGMTAGEAARIGVGFCLMACACVCLAVMAWEVYDAWTTEEEQPKDLTHEER